MYFGRDVIAIAEIAKGTLDEAVMERAFGEGRAHAGHRGQRPSARRLCLLRSSVGVIFVKFNNRARRSKPGAVVEVDRKIERAAVQ